MNFLFRSSESWMSANFLAVRVLQLVGQPIEAFVEAVARRGTGCLKSNEEAKVEPNQWQSGSKGQLDAI